MTFHLLHLKSYSIYEQLLLEETLLRSSSHNWCLINDGSSPAIVLGISGKKEQLVDLDRAALHPLPLIKRFSGGGTVVVDENTLFITFICQKELHPFPAYPEPILKWTANLYRDTFSHSAFALKENDYVLGDKKCGGNAQYIKKDRWLHHTSFLWDYSEELMSCLLHPSKTPSYRQDRSHTSFLCCLKDFFPTKQHFFNAFLNALGQRFTLQPTEIPQLPPLERFSTCFL